MGPLFVSSTPPAECHLLGFYRYQSLLCPSPSFKISNQKVSLPEAKGHVGKAGRAQHSALPLWPGHTDHQFVREGWTGGREGASHTGGPCLGLSENCLATCPQKGRSPFLSPRWPCTGGLGPDSSALTSQVIWSLPRCRTLPPPMTPIVAALLPLGKERLSFQRSPPFTTWSKPDIPLATMAGSGTAPCWSPA